MRIRHSSQGVIAAGHPQTAETAAAVLRDGGNAFDATVAALFTSCVCEPVLCSLGGGGFTLAQPSSGPARIFDYFVCAPLKPPDPLSRDFFPIEADFGAATQEFHIGRASIAVPGMTAGLFEIHRQLGRMPMRELVSQAAHLARSGVTIETYVAYLFRVVSAIYTATEPSRRLFASRNDETTTLGVGEISKNPEFGDLIESLSLEDERLFYQGDVAKNILADMRDGGTLSSEDLAQYRVALREPLRFTYGDATILGNPPPSSGGLLIQFAMALLQETNLGEHGFGSIAHAIRLIESMDKTNAARDAARQSDDNPVPNGARLFAGDFVKRYKREVGARLEALRGTTQLSIMDAAGNIATTTVSNGEGSAYVVPGTGVMLNNMLGEEDLNPNGFFNWPGGVRMTSMMAPTIVVLPDGQHFATGSGGSNRIRTAVLQVLLNLLEFGMPVPQAVAAPRLHFENRLLNFEPDFPRATVDKMREAYPRHHAWSEPNMFFGGAHTVAGRAGAFTGAGDGRRGGVLVVA